MNISILATIGKGSKGRKLPEPKKKVDSATNAKKSAKSDESKKGSANTGSPRKGDKSSVPGQIDNSSEVGGRLGGGVGRKRKSTEAMNGTVGSKVKSSTSSDKR